MSYYVDGSGYADLKSGVDPREIEKKLEFMRFWFSYNLGKDCITWYEDNKYHEDETTAFLQAIAPYINSGEAIYFGEDNDMWRFRFDANTEEWVEESGTVIYGMADIATNNLINELTRRGYTVTPLSE